MGKREEMLERLSAFMDSLSVDAKKKCAICNETLVHIIKQAEVETGVGTATATRALAEKINDGAAPQDVVSGDALRFRVRHAEGKRKSANGTDSQNQEPPTDKPGHTGHKLTPETVVAEIDKRVKSGKSVRDAAKELAIEHGKKPGSVRETYRREKEKTQYQCTATQAMSFAKMAIFQLERISKDDEQWDQALELVESWIETFRSKK